MICYIDNQKINLDISNLKNYLGSGVEGKVFRYKDQAVKIYYDYVDREKKEKKDCFFTTIKTDRIIPPRKIVRDVDGKYLGYANEVIKKREIFKHSSVDVTKEQVVNNFRLLENDSLAFANNFCLMHDVFYNRRDNGTLYFLDTSSYVIISRENSFYKIEINYQSNEERIQIEEAILKYKPTLIFVEHDEAFVKKVATKVIRLKKYEK